MTLAVVLLMGVFVTMYVLKSTGVLYVERSVDGTHDEIMGPTGHDYACEALVIRVFEQRLVDAGIESVEEMTTCDSPECKDCLPTRRAKARRAEPGAQKWGPLPYPVVPPRRPMAGKSRAEAISELRRDLPCPPKGKGGGSPMTPERKRQVVQALLGKTQ